MDYKKFCERCKHYEFNLKNGVICGLTNGKPNFEDTCKDFVLNEERVIFLENKKSTVYPTSMTKRFLNYLLDTVFIIFLLLSWYLF